MTEAAVERMKEVVAVPFVEIPAVFAVQRNHGEQGCILLAALGAVQTADEVFRGLVGGGILVFESNRVREPAVAKHQMDGRTTGLHSIGRIEQLRLPQPSVAIPVDGTARLEGKDALVAEHAVEPLLGGQPCLISRNR